MNLLICWGYNTLLQSGMSNYPDPNTVTDTSLMTHYCQQALL